MSKKKHKHEEHIDESWLIPYSDLLTLLLALFIVMFAMSQTDQKKFEQFGYAWKKMFDSGYVGVGSPAKKDGENKNKTEDKEQAKNKKAMSAAVSQEQIDKIKDLKKKLEEYIQQQHLQGEMSAKYTEDGLLIVLKDNILFDSGKAELITKDKQNVVHELATLFKVAEKDIEVVISGHTDNVPIKNSPFKDNWELSAMRATNFIRALLDDGHLNPATFSAQGLGEQKPLVPNVNDKNKSRNRRVEVLIRPRIDTSKLFNQQQEAAKKEVADPKTKTPQKEEKKTENKDSK